MLASGENVGGYYIDLRNLGANRTLVLLNGKRLGATTGGLQDLSQVPIAAIERIEVLKDGASAIYGSDAIAGVVNVITRKNFDGAEASAYVGQYDEDDGAKQTYSMTMGAHSDRGSHHDGRRVLEGRSGMGEESPVQRLSAGARIIPPRAGPWCRSTATSSCRRVIAARAAGLCALNPGGNPANPGDWHDIRRRRRHQ